jgi:hypothetical protein
MVIRQTALRRKMTKLLETGTESVVFRQFQKNINHRIWGDSHPQLDVMANYRIIPALKYGGYTS